MSAPDESGYTRDFAEVAAAEREWIAKRRTSAGVDADAALSALAFSGGGIRSATFNLGVLEALDRAGLMQRFDYLSTVSGGGYIGSAYSWLRAARSAAPPGATFDAPLADGTGTAMDWLRAHGKYLVANPGYSAWTLAGAILAATVLNVLVLGPLLMLATHLLTLSWLPVEWPNWLAHTALGQTRAHHGFWVLLVGAGLCLALFAPVAVVFGLRAEGARWFSDRAVRRLRLLLGWLLLAAAAFAVLGSIPLVDVWLDRMSRPLDAWLGSDVHQHLSYLLPLASGSGAVMLGKNSAKRGLILQLGLVLAVYGVLLLAYHFGAELGMVRHPYFPALFVLSVVLGMLCDINGISMHAYYRDRIAYAYLPQVVGAASTDARGFALTSLSPEHGAPFHVLNTTLNTTSSPNVIRRAREGESFAFSPLYVGSTSTGFVRTAQYPSATTALSTACTISGAAVDPNTYATSSRAVSFLMALFNFRLGYWGKNPWPGARRGLWLPFWWVAIGREMLGVGLDERHRHVHLSDGGHFDNLGVYEMIRRRVQRIVVVDAGEDAMLRLPDLGKLVERARVDFGASVRFDAPVPSAGSAPANWFYLSGQVTYADGSVARLLYVKPRMIDGLSADLVAYHNANPSFPDQSTADQFYGEADFEAYRALGRELTERLLAGDQRAAFG